MNTYNLHNFESLFPDYYYVYHNHSRLLRQQNSSSYDVNILFLLYITLKFFSKAAWVRDIKEIQINKNALH